ncbi:MAG: hypothetical protein R2834_02345 [Rhodothermales bacterium]
MKSFIYYTRRAHLYLGLFCLPWFVMYGISSVAFSHPEWFPSDKDLYNTAGDAWTEVDSWPCTVEVPTEGDVGKDLGAALLDVAGLDDKAFGAYRSGPRKVDVYFPAFWTTRRLSYDIDAQTLRLFTRKPLPQHILTGMHARAGYQHDSMLNDAWAFMVDVTSIGFLLWVLTGLVVWWQAPGLRGWGAAGLAAGILTFCACLMMM